MTRLPTGWCVRQLGDLAEVNPNQLSSTTPREQEIAYLDIAGIEETGRIAEPRVLRFGEAPSRARREARNGDIIVSTVRPYLRSFAQLTDAPPNLVVSTGFAVVRPKETCESDYLYQHVLSNEFVDFLKPRMKGGNYPAVTGDDVAAFTLPIPPLPEQRKIAAILSSVDEAIDKTRVVIDHLGVVKNAMMQDLLTKGLPGRHTRFKKTEIGMVPEEWDVRTVSMIGRVVTGSTPSTSCVDYWGGSVPFVTPGDLGEWLYPQGAIRSLTDSGASVARLVPKGAVLMTCIASIGKAGVAPWPCVTNQQINAVISHDCVPEFLFFALLSQVPALQRMAGKTAVPIVSKGKFEQLLVPVPHHDEQASIADSLRAIDENIIAQERVRQRGLALKSALMSVLLTGEVRVTPDEDAA